MAPTPPRLRILSGLSNANVLYFPLHFFITLVERPSPANIFIFLVVVVHRVRFRTFSLSSPSTWETKN